MSSLPKWAEEAKHDIHREDSCDWILEALSIAIEALEKMNSESMDWENGEIGVGSNFRREAQDALRRIEELGK